MDNQEEMKISDRLWQVASMIEPGSIVADVGTDHGYLPIYLVKMGISPQVIAMDIHEGPLEKARKNIEKLGGGDKIQLRLSDGLENLKEIPDVITICGMGGRLISRILNDAGDKLSKVKEIIASPQSEIMQFREYLEANDFEISDEAMIQEEGQYYVIIKCHPGAKQQPQMDCIERDVWLKYGRRLLESKSRILKQYLIKEHTKLFRIRENVINSSSAQADERIQELDYELRCIEKGLNYYEV